MGSEEAAAEQSSLGVVGPPIVYVAAMRVDSEVKAFWGLPHHDSPTLQLEVPSDSPVLPVNPPAILAEQAPALLPAAQASSAPAIQGMPSTHRCAAAFLCTWLQGPNNALAYYRLTRPTTKHSRNIKSVN